ncbi:MULTISPECIES: SDR family NAD(P)-dependent oxidoreductase [unclassified Frankia]|uniref:SDR family NAD(P)-dependent oxidoreductase n=1 Tax=unclassified Frankia TaxID=2632575 RepID=UPI002AD2F4AF|nr:MULTISPECIES: SDR family NAD(P)-dependent oxidoreductase [unclassified Frankia]
MTAKYEVHRALVTGAGSGMGQLLALRLVRRGIDLIAVDWDEAGLKVFKDAGPGKVTTHTVDVTDADAMAAVVTAQSHDLLVTAAGIGHTGRIVETPAAVHARIMAVNYQGTVNTVTAALPGYLAQGSGMIVLFSSILGWLPVPQHGPYGATKSALIIYAQTLRHELRGTGVKVSCVCPPAVATPMLDDMPAAKAVSQRTMMTPVAAVAAIERGLDRNRFWIFPGVAGPVALGQRLFPGVLRVAIGGLMGR